MFKIKLHSLYCAKLKEVCANDFYNFTAYNLLPCNIRLFLQHLNNALFTIFHVDVWRTAHINSGITDSAKKEQFLAYLPT